jgi:hypothetical protein
MSLSSLSSYKTLTTIEHKEGYPHSQYSREDTKLYSLSLSLFLKPEYCFLGTVFTHITMSF